MPAIEVGYLELLAIKFFKSIEIKLAAGLTISVLSFLYDSVYLDAMLAILLLLIFDFFSAILAQKKNGHPIQSAKIFRSAQKVVVYFLLISAGFLAERATQHILPFIDETIMGFLAVTELISILENIGHMGFAVPKKLLNQLTKYQGKQ